MVYETNHSLGFGVERSGEIGGVFFLEANTRAKGMIRVVLEDAASGVIDEYESLVPANISKGEGADHVGPDGLHLVGLTPVDVGAACDTGGVENVGGLHSLQVRH